MTELFHIADAADWAACTDQWTSSTRGMSLEQVGYIHLSYRDQVRGVLDAFYLDAPPVVVLVVDGSGLDVRDEVVPGHGVFPHLFGPLPVGSVVGTLPSSDF